MLALKQVWLEYLMESTGNVKEQLSEKSMYHDLRIEYWI